MSMCAGILADMMLVGFRGASRGLMLLNLEGNKIIRSYLDSFI